MAIPTIVPLLAQTASDLGSLHRTTGWWVVGYLGAIGLVCITAAVARRSPGRVLWTLIGSAFAAGVAQICLGLYVFGVEGVEPGNQHLFYGVVMSFTFAFVYIYRSQFAKRPALAYGLVLLFSMGLGIRGILTYGQSFGG